MKERKKMSESNLFSFNHKKNKIFMLGNFYAFHSSSLVFLFFILYFLCLLSMNLYDDGMLFFLFLLLVVTVWKRKTEHFVYE